MLQWTHRSEIGQACRHRCCRSICQISKRLEKIKSESRCLETSRNLVVIRLTAQWVQVLGVCMNEMWADVTKLIWLYPFCYFFFDIWWGRGWAGVTLVEYEYDRKDLIHTAAKSRLSQSIQQTGPQRPLLQLTRCGIVTPYGDINVGQH